MNISNIKRFLSAFVGGAMVLSFTACGGSAGSSSSSAASATTAAGDSQTASSTAGGADSKFIADRKITVKTFDEDIGLAQPADMNNAVAEKIKEITGMSMEIIYVSGPSSREALTTAIASGDLPDVISHYLNDSTRPEMPIVKKAAKEGIFTDVAPYLKASSVYSKYYQDGYLPFDAYQNIIQNPEFNGATYIVQVRFDRTDDVPFHDIRGGMYIQKSIVDALNLDPSSIKTSDDLYKLLNDIKAGVFKDAFGNDVTPLGTSYWGNSGDNVRQYVFQNYMVGNNAWQIKEGKVLHQLQTENGMELVKFARKLLDEGLMHKEFFKMDSARSQEAALSYSYAILEDCHSGMTTELFDKVDYVPLGPLVDANGHNYLYKAGKRGYGAWEIPATTKNPEEIVKFADFLASKEGKLLWQYGIEGVHYDLKDGNPLVKREVLDKAKEEPDYLINENIWGGGSGSAWGALFGRTDMDTMSDFGEISYGEATDPDKFTKQEALNNYLLDKRPYDKTVLTKGFKPNNFLTDFENAGGSTELRTLLDDSSYYTTLIAAIYAKSEDEAKKILDNYLDQMNKSGLEEFEALLLKTYNETPEMLDIRTDLE